MKKFIVYFILFFGLVASCFAELTDINDDDLSDVTGQSGVYLSGEISINDTNQGGPMNSGYFGNCSAGRVCGARMSFQTQQSGGWFVLDDIRGTIAFEGLTLQIRTIADAEFGGDGALLFNKDVMEIGLPGTLRMNGFQYTLATSNDIRPGDTGFTQVDFMTVEMSGEVILEGNLLIIPTP